VTRIKLPLTFLVAAAVLAPLAGCSKPDPLKAAGNRLVGVWVGKPEPTGGQKKADVIEMEGEIVFKFQADGTFSIEFPILGAVKGTWQVGLADGDKLTVKTSEEWPSVSVSFETDEKGKTTEKEVVTTRKEDGEYTIVFKGDDQIVVTPKAQPDEPMKLDRKR
jgi:hypothetical protein